MRTMTPLSRRVSAALGEGSGSTSQQSNRLSTSTVQRCKVISSYITKIHSDVRVLLDVQDALEFVTNHLEKEKTDAHCLEKIAKEAVVTCQAMEDSQILDSIFNSSRPRAPTPAFFPSPAVMTTAEPENDILIDTLRRGLDAHDVLGPSELDNNAGPLDYNTLKNGLDEPDILPLEDNEDEDIPWFQ